jgi:hypothetical protein
MESEVGKLRSVLPRRESGRGRRFSPDLRRQMAFAGVNCATTATAGTRSEPIFLSDCVFRRIWGIRCTDPVFRGASRMKHLGMHDGCEDPC